MEYNLKDPSNKCQVSRQKILVNQRLKNYISTPKQKIDKFFTQKNLLFIVYKIDNWNYLNLYQISLSRREQQIQEIVPSYLNYNLKIQGELNVLYFEELATISNKLYFAFYNQSQINLFEITMNFQTQQILQEILLKFIQKQSFDQEIIKISIEKYHFNQYFLVLLSKRYFEFCKIFMFEEMQQKKSICQSKPRRLEITSENNWFYDLAFCNDYFYLLTRNSLEIYNFDQSLKLNNLNTIKLQFKFQNSSALKLSKNQRSLIIYNDYEIKEYLIFKDCLDIKYNLQYKSVDLYNSSQKKFQNIYFTQEFLAIQNTQYNFIVIPYYNKNNNLFEVNFEQGFPKNNLLSFSLLNFYDFSTNFFMIIVLDNQIKHAAQQNAEIFLFKSTNSVLSCQNLTDNLLEIEVNSESLFCNGKVFNFTSHFNQMKEKNKINAYVVENNSVKFDPNSYCHKSYIFKLFKPKKNQNVFLVLVGFGSFVVLMVLMFIFLKILIKRLELKSDQRSIQKQKIQIENELQNNEIYDKFFIFDMDDYPPQIQRRIHEQDQPVEESFHLNETMTELSKK